MRNAFKYGGYAMFINEVVKKVKDLQTAKEVAKAKLEQKSTTRDTRNLIIGATIGTAVGAAAGLLFAPRSGQETRDDIARKTHETLEALQENAAVTKDQISSSVSAQKAHYVDIAERCAEAIKQIHEEALKNR